MPDQSHASEKAVTLFLSYARDDETYARRLASALKQSGYTIWWDALIQGGAAYSRSIAEALETADVVIVLWSARSIESDWVRDEAGQGRERHRLVPLSIDGSKPPLGFRQYQVIDISHWHGRKNAPEMTAIERAIESVLGQRSRGASTAGGPGLPPDHANRRIRRRGCAGRWRSLVRVGARFARRKSRPTEHCGPSLPQPQCGSVAGLLLRRTDGRSADGTHPHPGPAGASGNFVGEGGGAWRRSQGHRRGSRRRLHPVRFGPASGGHRPDRDRSRRRTHRFFALVPERRSQADRHLRRPERYRADGCTGDVGRGRHH